jgi:CheY-like chemotaxis protein/HPt (histidine-containing phosphotransfer) domain-containing protein
MDGLELARRVRAELPRPPRFVLVTAFGREEVRSRAEAAGVDAFLLKPVNASLLVDTLVELFAAPGGARVPRWIDEALPRFEGARVLVVEDNEVNRQIAGELIEATGIEVEMATDGEEALRRLRALPPDHFDLVFMDLQMPHMDGHEATRQLRADARFDRLPIVAMTAHAMVQERERCLAEGMNDHVAKPVVPQQLYATLQRWLGARQVSAGEPLAAPAPPASCAALQAVRGLDVESGLDRLRGQLAAYEDLLRRFCEDQADAVQRTGAALRDGRLEDARRALHTLRGLAATIGADALAQASGSAEQALSDLPAASVLACLGPLERMLATLIEQLRAALGALSPPTARGDSTDGAGEQAVLQRLRALLEEDDAEAVEWFHEHREVIAAALGDGLAALERPLNNFALPQALAALQQVH